MPLARTPDNANTGLVYIPGAVAGETILEGQAVALIDEAGSPVFRLCGSDTYARQFIGFAAGSVLVGQRLGVYANRGSVVEPVVEGGGTLTVNTPVWLSSTPGEVTQVFSTVIPSGNTVYQVGYAHTSTQMALTTDYRVDRP